MPRGRKKVTPTVDAAVEAKEAAVVEEAAPAAEPAPKKKTVRKPRAAKAAAPAKEKAAAPAKEKAVAADAAAEAPKKRGGRKPKPKEVTVDTVVEAISKKINKTAAKAIAPDGKAAVDVKLYGAFEAHMYIEVKDGAVTVAPHDYIDKDIEAAVPVDTAMAVAQGKMTVKEAVENGSLYVFGNVKFALMLAKLFD